MTIRRVALVTGGNRGIGLETCRQLAEAGITVVLGARNAEKGAAAAASLTGLSVTSVALDVTNGASATAAIQQLAARHGRLDILVNNAGVYLDKGPNGQISALDVDPELLTRTYDTNVTGALRMIQACVPKMKDNGYGRIVNVSSIMGQLASMPGGAVAYRSSKTALNAVTRVVAAELGAGEIKINSMHPGWVKTDMGGANAPRTVAEAADTAVFLATLPEGGPTGGFFENRKPIAW